MTEKIVKIEKPFAILHSDPIESQTSITASAIPGLHIVANFSVVDLAKLSGFVEFRNFINAQIEANGLCKVGEVYHNFEQGGYTAVVCLTESHLSIHTWPENNYLTFDVFLSNHLKDNRTTTRRLYENVKTFFEATILFEKIIDR